MDITLNKVGDRVMMPINLGYVVLGVSDISRWTLLVTQVIGMQCTDDQDTHVGFRVDNLSQRLMLQEGNDDIVAAGWQFDNPEELVNFVAHTRAKGLEIVLAPVELQRQRRVQALYVCLDPQGWQHEFYAGPEEATTPFKSPIGTAPSFLTGSFGLGHILVCVANSAAALEFYCDGIGLMVSDTIREEVRPGLVVDATFLHARAGRHHSLAIAALPGEKRLSHLMVEVEKIDDVGRAYDRCLQLGFPIHMSMGKHPNDHCFSFYLMTPSGFSIEVGYGSIVIDDATWEATHYDRLSDWGHRRVPPASAAR